MKGREFFYADFLIFEGCLKKIKGEIKMANGVCVVCEGSVGLPEDCCMGEILVCADCGTELELVSMDPIALEEAPQVQEDWGE